jgi:hypothetical protein
MTVGGNTRGKAIRALTGRRHTEFDLANHQAMGVPMINSNTVTKVASFKVSQIACQSASLSTRVTP